MSLIKRIRTENSLLMEIVRFLLVGGLATVVDYLVYALFYYIILKDLSSITYTFIFIPSDLNTTLSITAGFICGNIVNYFLSIVFVYIGAKQDKSTQTAKSFIVFTIIGVLGLLLKICLQNGGNALVGLLQIEEERKFLLWFLNTCVYAVATLIVLVWNYVGRKLLIFKNAAKLEKKEKDPEMEEENQE